MDEQIVVPDHLPIVTFDASTCTAVSYGDFIRAIRNTASVQNADLGMLELARPDEANIMENFFLINLTSFNYSIYLVCRKKNLYLVAYTTTFRTIRFFSDTDAAEMEAVFPGYHVDPIGMQAAYQYLVEEENVDVVHRPIGIPNMQDAIRELADEDVSRARMATSMVVLLVFILEPARIVRLFNLISAFADSTYQVYKKFKMGTFHNACIGDWGMLSREAHQANLQTGKLKRKVTLTGTLFEGDPMYVQPVDIHTTYKEVISTVADVQAVVAVLNSRN